MPSSRRPAFAFAFAAVGLLCCAAAVTAGGCCPPPSTRAAHAAACRRVLLAQQAAWNRGDIAAFARGYLRSPRLVFASAGNLSVGYAAMLARYRKRYPDRTAMGQLSFSQLRFTAVDGETMSVRGRWRLERARPIAGSFLLVMRHVESAWRVAVDYTTVDGRR